MSDDAGLKLLAAIEALAAEVRLLSERLPPLTGRQRAARSRERYRALHVTHPPEEKVTHEVRTPPPLPVPSPSPSVPTLSSPFIPLPLEKTKALSAQKPTGKVLSLLSPPEKHLDAAEVVFEHWKASHRKPRALLDVKRRRAIERQFQVGRTVDDLCRAVDGCLRDDFSQGRNDSGKKFDDIALICRDAEHVEKFMSLAPRATGPPVVRKTDGELLAEAYAEAEAKNGRV